MELEQAQAQILAEETLRAIDSGIELVKPGSLPGDWRALRGCPLIAVSKSTRRFP